MLRTILVGLDGSSYSAAAVELGIRWAQKCNAMLVGVGIIDEPTVRKGELLPIGGTFHKQHRDTARVADARRQVETFLGRFSVQCAEAGIACKLLEDVGLPWEQICLEAQRYDLILLGQQTFYHFETQSDPDETLSKVLKASPRPVVTVPERLQSGRSVVVAYDGSLNATRTLQAFQGLRLDPSLPVHVVSVDAKHIDAARRADRAVEFLRFHEIEAEPHAIATSSTPASVILEQALRLGAELVVMGACSRAGLYEFCCGSVTRALLKSKQVALFLYH
jgi:nucleotide-binding universal stress UspA family protein